MKKLTRKRKTKEGKKRIEVLDQPTLFQLEGHRYCENYNDVNPTCLQCTQNHEGPWRAGCFKRGPKLK